jgi:putative peptidoglycan lipid II flippase
LAAAPLSGFGGIWLRPTRWPTWTRVSGLVVVAKGFAFLREPVIAAAFGANAATDAYYLAVGVPFILYNLLGVPFSLWVTARLAASNPGIGDRTAGAFYRHALRWGIVTGALAAAALALLSRTVMQALAPGLKGDRLDQAVALARIAAVALPALVLQAVCSGRLFAERRFASVYAWLAVGGAVGLGGVLFLIPRYGPAGAVAAFAATWWTAGLGLFTLAHRGMTAPSTVAAVPWGEDLGPGVVYRALAMQVFFQGNGLLVYSFASRLAAGEIAAALFASKIIMAIYETIVLTAGVLVFPRIAHLLHHGDERAVGPALTRALDRLLPVTMALIVLLALSPVDLVALIYRRHAFDDRATVLVSRALLGYAPYVIGMTLVEILHRAMVLRGRIAGYFIVFATGLLVTWIANLLLVSPLGVLGVSLSSAVGVVAAAGGLWIYAHRRLPHLRLKPIALLLGRTLVAGLAALLVAAPLLAHLPRATTEAGRVLVLAGDAVVAGALFSGFLFLLGYRWREVSPPVDRAATS